MKIRLLLLVLLQVTLTLANVDESCAANLGAESGQQKGDLLLQKPAVGTGSEKRPPLRASRVPATLTQAHLGESNYGKPADDSLFCFMLVVPDSWEMTLVQQQVEQHVGIFDCNEHLVLSNEVIELSHVNKTQTEAIEAGYLNDRSLTVEVGGIYNAALNTEIFVRVWRKIIADRRFEKHAWTVKVDTDTVFFPERLREFLRSQGSAPDKAAYFQNCPDIGMHGAIEVITRGGMEALRSGMGRCLKANVADFKDYSEDVWLQKCFDFLQVPAVTGQWKLLSDIYCQSHSSTPCLYTKVAYHPYKDPEAYFACLKDALHPIDDD